MRLLKYFVLLLVFLLGLAFAVRNAVPVHLDYYLGQIEAPLSLVVVFTLLTGAVLGVLACLGIILRTKRQASQLRRSLSVVEQELANLRTGPYKDLA